MHWCMDETLAVLAMIPLIGILFHKLHVWWHNKFKHKCHEDGCDSVHVEHTEDDSYSPFDRDSCDNRLTRGDTLIICGWDSLCIDDVEGRYGGTAIDDLIGDCCLLGVDERPADDEFRWFVNDGKLRAVFKERVFCYDDSCFGDSWHEVSSEDLGAELKNKW